LKFDLRKMCVLCIFLEQLQLLYVIAVDETPLFGMPDAEPF